MKAQATASFISAIVGVGVLFALGYFLQDYDLAEALDRATDPDAAMAQVEDESRRLEEAPTGEPAPRGAVSTGDAAIEALFEARRSDVMVTASGVVDRVLADDNEGSRHQKFVVRLASGRTLLVAHNIDLAPRVPLSRGDEVTLRGEYEWTEQGGTMHWTHHDPKKWREGGWIEHEGERYE